MRLLLLNHNLREHGTFFRAFHLARELVRRGHEATLVTVSPEHWYRTVESERDGVRLIETPSWNPVVGPDDGWGPIDVPARLALVLREQYDLLYAFAHPPDVYLPARLASLVRRKPVVADWCDVYRDGIFPLREEIRAYQGVGGWRLGVQRFAERVERRLERRAIRKASAATVISTYLRDAALAEGVPEDRLLLYPSGANLDAVAPRDKTECRRELGIEGEGPFLGYVANYNPDERFFLDALARVFRRLPGARLIAAAPPFTPSLVQKHGVGEQLVEIGRLPFHRMTTVLGAADVLALPLEDNVSNRGRWPNKFGDYLAAGRPTVANAIGDTARWFPPEDAPDAIGATAPCDPEAFGAAMARTLERRETWDAMGVSARRLAETRLNWATLAETVEQFLERFAAPRENA